MQQLKQDWRKANELQRKESNFLIQVKSFIESKINKNGKAIQRINK